MYKIFSRVSEALAILLFVSALSILIIPSVVVIGSLFTTHTSVYDAILNEEILYACLSSLCISVPTAISSAIISFSIGISWSKGDYKKYTLVGLIFLLVIPPEVQSVSLLSLLRLTDLSIAKLLVLIFAHTAYVLPYCSFLLIVSSSLIDDALSKSIEDMGLTALQSIRHVYLPAFLPAVVSAFILSLILSLNEFTRTKMLSGSWHLLSEQIAQRLSSGTGESIYAVASFNIFLTTGIFLLLTVLTLAYYTYFEIVSLNSTSKAG